MAAQIPIDKLPTAMACKYIDCTGAAIRLFGTDATSTWWHTQRQRYVLFAYWFEWGGAAFDLINVPGSLQISILSDGKARVRAGDVPAGNYIEKTTNAAVVQSGNAAWLQFSYDAGPEGLGILLRIGPRTIGNFGANSVVGTGHSGFVLLPPTAGVNAYCWGTDTEPASGKLYRAAIIANDIAATPRLKPGELAYGLGEFELGFDSLGITDDSTGGFAPVVSTGTATAKFTNDYLFAGSDIDTAYVNPQVLGEVVDRVRRGETWAVISLGDSETGVRKGYSGALALLMRDGSLGDSVRSTWWHCPSSLSGLDTYLSHGLSIAYERYFNTTNPGAPEPDDNAALRSTDAKADLETYITNRVANGVTDYEHALSCGGRFHNRPGVATSSDSTAFGSLRYVNRVADGDTADFTVAGFVYVKDSKPQSFFKFVNEGGMPREDGIRDWGLKEGDKIRIGCTFVRQSDGDATVQFRYTPAGASETVEDAQAIASGSDATDATGILTYESAEITLGSEGLGSLVVRVAGPATVAPLGPYFRVTQNADGSAPTGIRCVAMGIGGTDAPEQYRIWFTDDDDTAATNYVQSFMDMTAHARAGVDGVLILRSDGQNNGNLDAGEWADYTYRGTAALRDAMLAEHDRVYALQIVTHKQSGTANFESYGAALADDIGNEKWFGVFPAYEAVDIFADIGLFGDDEQATHLSERGKTALMLQAVQQGLAAYSGGGNRSRSRDGRLR